GLLRFVLLWRFLGLLIGCGGRGGAGVRRVGLGSTRSGGASIGGSTGSLRLRGLAAAVPVPAQCRLLLLGALTLRGVRGIACPHGDGLLALLPRPGRHQQLGPPPLPGSGHATSAVP